MSVSDKLNSHIANYDTTENENDQALFEYKLKIDIIL
jgi:hypothetical protein